MAARKFCIVIILIVKKKKSGWLSFRRNRTTGAGGSLQAVLPPQFSDKRGDEEEADKGKGRLWKNVYLRHGGAGGKGGRGAVQQGAHEAVGDGVRSEVSSVFFFFPPSFCFLSCFLFLHYFLFVVIINIQPVFFFL